MKKITFVLWVLVACIAFITLVCFSIIYGDAVQQHNEQAEEVAPIIYDKAPAEAEQEEEKQIFLLTAYCPCVECSEGYGNMTATGKRAVEGRTIAVDPDVIEYGTRLYIDGVGYRTAEDCGGLVKGKHIDIYFDCHSKVNAFGKKYAEVEI